MTPWIIWTVALLVYLLFRWWYDSHAAPLTRQEIERFLATLHESHHEAANSIEVWRRFLEADDGREFFMVNLVKVQPESVTDPRSGEPVPGSVLFRRYARRFLPVLLRHAGHPVMAGRKVGGYVDAWNVAPDPEWTLFGLMRYRSRRDLLKLVEHPAFKAAHPEKQLGTAATFSFPAQPMVALHAGPRVAVALGLALVAALLHLMHLIHLAPLTSAAG